MMRCAPTAAWAAPSLSECWQPERGKGGGEAVWARVNTFEGWVGEALPGRVRPKGGRCLIVSLPPMRVARALEGQLLDWCFVASGQHPITTDLHLDSVCVTPAHRLLALQATPLTPICRTVVRPPLSLPLQCQGGSAAPAGHPAA